MHKQGDILTLKGKTLKGKNRIREQGDKWRVIQIYERYSNDPEMLDIIRDETCNGNTVTVTQL